MAKLVDALDLGSSAVRRGGSIPFIRTKKKPDREVGLFSFFLTVLLADHQDIHATVVLLLCRLLANLTVRTNDNA